MNQFITLDTETGGLFPAVHALLELAAVCTWQGGQARFQAYVQVAGQPAGLGNDAGLLADKIVDPEAAKVNGYAWDEWERRGALPLQDVMTLFRDWLNGLLKRFPDAVIVCHNLEFDRGFLREAERVTGVELPHRHNWRCSQSKFGELMDKGVIARGSAGLERLGVLSGLWPEGGRPEVHGAEADAVALQTGYAWLLEQERKQEDALRQLYTESLKQRRDLEAQIPEVQFPSSGVQRIANERQRQIEQKGYTRLTDAVYTLSQLLQGALCYAETAHMQITKGIEKLPPCYWHKNWPWDRSTFHASDDPRENLTKAGAMIAAELDRLPPGKEAL